MTEREIVRRVYKAYRAAGMTDAGAWGMLGNASCESTLCPYRLQGDFSDGYSVSLAYTQRVDSGAVSKDDFVYRGPNGGGYGFFQWTLQSRKAQMYDEMKKAGCSIGDLQLAIDFSLQELKTDSYFRNKVWSVLSTTDSIREASDVVCRIYENPAVKNYDPRYNAAVSLRDKYAGDMDGDDDPPDPDPEPTPEPDEHKLILRTIDCHCSDWPEVTLLGAALYCRKYLSFAPGYWDDEMTEAVKEFQRDHELTADGVVGPKTWDKLLQRG